MSLALYQIADDYRSALYNLSNILDDQHELDDESKKQIIEDSLVHFVDDFKKKSINVGCFINEMKLELEAVKIAENRFISRRKSLENKINSLTDYLFVQFLKTGINTVKNEEIVISIKNNPPKVILEDESKIDQLYKEVIETVKVSKSTIATALKNGLFVDGARLESSKRLEIK